MIPNTPAPRIATAVKVALLILGLTALGACETTDESQGRDRPTGSASPG